MKPRRNEQKADAAILKLAAPLSTTTIMPDSKLLAFSVLLGSVFLYLLFKSKRSRGSNRTSRKTGESLEQVLQRRAQLVERAAKVEKICKRLDAQFLEDVDEIKVLAKKYHEQLEEMGEDGWKVNLKTGRDTYVISLNSAYCLSLLTLPSHRASLRKLKRFSDSASSASSSEGEDRPRQKKNGGTICPGLRYEGNRNKQQLEFTFSDVPATNVEEDDKKMRRKPLNKSIVKVANVVNEHPETRVRLQIRPPAPEEEEESIRVGDLVQDTPFATSTFRQLMPKKFPASTAALLGHGFATANEERDYAYFLSQLLNTLRPANMRISFLPSAHDGRSGLPGQERCLIPAMQTPLALIGNKLFRDRKNALETLEVGTYIPVSQDSGSKYLFAFAEWRSKTLMISYQAAASSSERALKSSGYDALPSILFDPTYGFVRMMSGAQEDKDAESGISTKIVLNVTDEAVVKRFRKQVEGLAKVRERGQASDHEYSDPASRLELFRRKLYYKLDEEPQGRPRPVWQV